MDKPRASMPSPASSSSSSSSACSSASSSGGKPANNRKRLLIGTTKSAKSIGSKDKRMAANDCDRKRMHLLNEAYSKLRRRLQGNRFHSISESCAQSLHVSHRPTCLHNVCSFLSDQIINILRLFHQHYCHPFHYFHCFVDQICNLIMEPDNIERYDRQIRLWGQHGQSKCSNSKICLINANSLGTEILKGLCLAGIGSFTIIDSHKLTPDDLGCNFIPQSSVGKGRGETVKQMLLDLNDQVSGEVFPLEAHLPHFVDEDLKSKVTEDQISNLLFWKQFNCVIACGFLHIDQIVRLGKFCWTLKIPLILAKSIGYFGSMRTQLKEHIIIESHPEYLMPDYYLDRPFKDLKEYFDSIDLENEANLDKAGHYPFVVIVYKYLKKWQTKNCYSDSRLPSSYKERNELKSLIDEGYKVISKRRQAKKGDSSTSAEESIPFENFMEASKSVNTCFAGHTSTLPDTVRAIFDNPKASGNIYQNPSGFWLIIRAVKEFVLQRNDNRLPISGSIPDMISSSDEYIRLQTIYSKKAKEDIDNVLALAQNLANTPISQQGASLFDETKLICRNIRCLEILTTSKIQSEYGDKTNTLSEEDDEDEFITISLCLRALDLFFSTYGRLPGHQDDQVEVDISKLKGCVKQIVGKVSHRLRALEQCLYELCRCGGAELHATSAFLGGCIAQEAIKLITNQYIPVNDTLVFNAMTASTRSFKSSDIYHEA